MISPTERMIAEIDGPIGWMVFNNPAKLNAMAPDMWAAIPAIIDHYEKDPAVRVVVLKGAGEKAFISGADINRFEERLGSAQVGKSDGDNMREALDRLEHCTKPTIAMIRGYCIGGGVGLALCCDLRICSDNSKFGVPAAKLGLGYGFKGIKKLVDVVGPSFAKEIFFTARQFTAAEALAMGLVNRVLPEADLEKYVQDYAATIGGNAPLTVNSVKYIVGEVVKDASERNLKRCADLVAECFASNDYKEGRTAFMEKRKPAFTGS
jgi:enoyl-CoA hydratase